MSIDERQAYARIANDCREAKVPFPAELAKQFARVARQLNEDWGKPAAAEFLQDLIFPSRPGRRGFPPEVAEEILALKNLHEERYANLLQTVWDPFDMLYKDSSGEKDKPAASASASATDQKLNTPSIYRTRNQVPPAPAGRTDGPALEPSSSTAGVPLPAAPATPPAPSTNYSQMVAQLLPEAVRRQVNQVRTMRAQSGAASALPAPSSELEELLADAEQLLEDGHLNSGTAILEQVTTLFPDESPFAYLRLMEIYYLIQRQEDYDWVAQRMCEQFNCDKLEWVAPSETFKNNLDRLAERYLIGLRRS
jgi:hypothetical protein